MTTTFPSDADLFAEIDRLSRETDALYEQRDRLAGRVASQEKKLRRITKLLDELWQELR